MNRIGIAVVMVIIAGIICGCEVYTVRDSATDYSLKLDEIGRLMNEEEFEYAGELATQLLINWKDTLKHLDKYLYHDYIDEVTEGLAVLPVYAESKDNIAVKAQIEDIKIQLTSLKESELPYLHNIL